MDVGQIVQSLLPIVANVIGGLLKSSDAGIFGKIREMGALAQSIGISAEQFRGNPIVENLISALDGQEFADIMKNMDIKNLDISTALNSVDGMTDVLRDAPADTAVGVKQFIMNLATNMANAAGGGIFGTGAKVSAEEQQFLTSLQQRLGT